jgi:hypothetical protein
MVLLTAATGGGLPEGRTSVSAPLPFRQLPPFNWDVVVSRGDGSHQCAGFADVDGDSDHRRLTSRHQQRNAGERPFPLPLPASPQAMGQGFELLRISAKPGRRSGFHCKQCCLIWLPNRLVTDCLTLSLPGRQRGWSKRAGGHWAPGAAPRIVIALS